jgi:hypothetical protein
MKKIQKNTYKNNIWKESKKIIWVRKGCCNAHQMARNWLRRFKNTRIEIWPYMFNWWNPYWQENLIWGRKVQNQIFMDSIKFYLMFNWIYGGFNCNKKLIFKSI